MNSNLFHRTKPLNKETSNQRILEVIKTKSYSSNSLLLTRHGVPSLANLIMPKTSKERNLLKRLKVETRSVKSKELNQRKLQAAPKRVSLIEKDSKSRARH
jgi:hypothetical protein